MVGMIYTEGRDSFEAMLASQMHRLRDVTAEFIGGMATVDKESFLRIAIDSAWDHRNEFKPRPGYGLPQYWKRCLKFAATSRDKWRVAVATLPGVFEYRWVLGTRLGEK
jgi:hypothetical protein